MKAAILTKHNAPLELMEILWGDLRHGQVKVQIIATGICGAQLAEIRGEKNPEAPLPRLMGHEAVVRILECGRGVKVVKPGDKAIAHWRKGSGVESQFPHWSCLEGEFNMTYRATRESGLITTFSTHSVISGNRLTPVPEDTPDELCCLLGCSLSTALGVIENEANVKIGESVLIIGCGGLGLNLILAAKLRQAGRIYVMDIHPDKEAQAMAMGATAFIDASIKNFTARSPFPPWPATLRLYPSEKCDVIIDTSGDPEVIGFTLEHCLAPSGRFIMVGQPKPGASITIENARHLFEGSGKTIMATQGGRFSPSVDISRYVAAWRAGRLNLDGIISHRLPLSDINAGLDLVRAGHAGRVLIDCAE